MGVPKTANMPDKLLHNFDSKKTKNGAKKSPKMMDMTDKIYT